VIVVEHRAVRHALVLATVKLVVAARVAVVPRAMAATMIVARAMCGLQVRVALTPIRHLIVAQIGHTTR
jgi:hypothetical protein